MPNSLQTFAAVALTTVLAGTAAACGASDTATTLDTAATSAQDRGEHAAPSGDAVTLEKGTVRAKADAGTEHGNDMTSIFGTLRNHTDSEITITGFTTSLGGNKNQIHEVKDGVMQEKGGGITISAGGSHELEPGGDHLMVMDYAEPIHAGDTLTLTLQLADGSAVEIPDLAVRTMAAGEEDYGDQMQKHEGHSH
ncbi:copper chaperone PCu(A)C [Corynebacterium sp. Q4381]|uniref:copper chaperone PCu(A)C n=1 Tax=Corynebacterium sp. Marseille-Q4381 TaxID=3121597 RepID=UPI002FE5C69F